MACVVLTAFSPSAHAGAAFGSFSTGDPYSGHTRNIDSLERDTGRRVSIVHWFQNWGGGAWVSKVQKHTFKAVKKSKRRSLVTWEPWTPGHGPWQPNFSLARIAGGAHDAYIRSWAKRLKRTKTRVYLRPMHEMNGDWYPWGGTVNNNSPRLFRKAWRRMHRIFRQQKVRNVRWVWSPLHEDVPGTRANRFERYYPGRKYVDVLAMSGYNYGSNYPHFGGWRSFNKIFNKAYKRMKRLGRQPIWIAEVGSLAQGGDKAAWVRGMWRKARRMKRLKAIVWYDAVRDGRDWRARSPDWVAKAFKPRY